jgi:hypothetical protein
MWEANPFADLAEALADRQKDLPTTRATVC